MHHEHINVILVFQVSDELIVRNDLGVQMVPQSVPVHKLLSVDDELESLVFEHVIFIVGVEKPDRPFDFDSAPKKVHLQIEVLHNFVGHLKQTLDVKLSFLLGHYNWLN